MDMLSGLLGKNQEKQQPVFKKEKSGDYFFCINAKFYFDIEEEQIFQRIKSAITLRPVFSELINEKPDLYGPFWIATTLIVIIVASSSLVTFFGQASGAVYNFDQISVAASLIYGISFGCPYIIAILVKIFGGLVSVVDLICIYGYSLTAFIPITFFCFINSQIIQIILLTIAFCLSSAFLIRGMLSLDRNLGEKEKGVLGVFILGTQLLLVFMYKFYFFGLA